MNIDNYKESGKIEINDPKASTSRIKNPTTSDEFRSNAINNTPLTKQNTISGSTYKEKEINKVEIIRKMEAKINIPNFGGTPIGIGSSTVKEKRGSSMADINLNPKKEVSDNTNVGNQGKGSNLQKRIQKMK